RGGGDPVGGGVGLVDGEGGDAPAHRGGADRAPAEGGAPSGGGGGGGRPVGRGGARGGGGGGGPLPLGEPAGRLVDLVLQVGDLLVAGRGGRGGGFGRGRHQRQGHGAEQDGGAQRGPEQGQSAWDHGSLTMRHGKMGGQRPASVCGRPCARYPG